MVLLYRYEKRMDDIRVYLDAMDIKVGTRRRVIAFYERLWRGKVYHALHAASV